MQVRFGPFVLDSESRELLRDDQRVLLSPKAFALLGILVESRPKAVPKTELQERLWPATFVVEKNLANLVSEIRAALGDDASDPQFIRTVPRFGYAFREIVHRADAGQPMRRGDVAFRITWISGRATLDEGDYVLGRDPNVEIYLDGPKISRRHARITIAAARATIEDLGSKNGTFVGDQRVDASVAIGHGDVITIGSVKLTVTALRMPSSTETEGTASTRSRILPDA
jgi:DNA-binding winged helix-turn-helix (wHTH) protein